MALEKWSRVKPLKDPKSIEVIEKKFGCNLSSELKDCILENNGGRPKLDFIKLENGEEYDVKILLSYNEDDIENIYKVSEFFIKNFNGKMIPFASDSAGNYYCECDGKIVLWTQDDEVLSVCDGFKDFLNSLYE